MLIYLFCHIQKLGVIGCIIRPEEFPNMGLGHHLRVVGQDRHVCEEVGVAYGERLLRVRSRVHL